MGSDPIAQIDFLARAESRVRIVEHLLETESATRDECRAHVEASRTTVARTLDALEERGWIAKAGREYELTPVGAIVAEEFLDLVETVRVTEELSTFLTWFPYEEFGPDPTALSDAKVTTATPGEPYAPARKHGEVFESASRFRGLLPSVGRDASAAAYEQYVADELDGELIVSQSVESTIESEAYAPLYREPVADGRLDLFVAEEEPPFYLGLVDDDRVQIGVEDEEGFPRALLETDSAAIRSWGETVYEEYRTAARRKPATELP